MSVALTINLIVRFVGNRQNGGSGAKETDVVEGPVCAFLVSPHHNYKKCQLFFFLFYILRSPFSFRLLRSLSDYANAPMNIIPKLRFAVLSSEGRQFVAMIQYSKVFGNQLAILP